MFDNLKQMKQLMGMLGNPEAIRAQAEAMQEELAKKIIYGQSGGGAVKVKMSGAMRVLAIEIEPTMLTSLTGDDKDAHQMAQELIMAAVNDGLEKIQATMQDEMAGGMGGILGG